MTELIQKYGNINIAKGDYMLPAEVEFPPYIENLLENGLFSLR